MPEFTFTKLNFLDMLKLTSLKSILKIKGIQGVPEYLLKVKRGGLDHHYSTKKSHFSILSEILIKRLLACCFIWAYFVYVVFRKIF